ncbi:hypothetical protein HNO92_002316 [Chromobacterium alkanivorans]|uniref:hypothetical protein n=1 Tax=Chromobacterium alkanivorans TaxID=1071719 RepID=UPI002167FCA5|nr:hypothetical protein [Chromobacterium alkanivorans]MCS3804947.1 hypothetical protein [Chromobacterium alkanivorans]MCS3819490.1 hypothetical protein [Chromobacterium alkanivorans]MCS3874002.1 hypothetical protein [Chromobacterium alkanivorans]
MVTNIKLRSPKALRWMLLAPLALLAAFVIYREAAIPADLARRPVPDGKHEQALRGIADAADWQHYPARSPSTPS